MTRAEIEKEIAYAEMALSTIKNASVPMLILIYDGEKDVVKKALSKYLTELRDELMGRQKNE